MDLSEVELGDVGLVEDVRRAEHDRRADAGGGREHLVAAKRAGREACPGRQGGGTGSQRGRRVAGQVTEVGRVPQLELLDRAVLDVRLHLRREPEAGQRELREQALVRVEVCLLYTSPSPRD